MVGDEDELTPLVIPLPANAISDIDEVIEDQYEGVPKWRQPSIYWLIVPFCIYTAAFGAVVVPRLNVILSLICRDFFAGHPSGLSGGITSIIIGGDNNSNEICQDPRVHSLVSKFTMYMSLITGVCSAITAPKLGILSDQYGRKPLIALSSLGLLTSEVFTILAGKYPDTISVYTLLIGSFIDGICGSFLVAQAVSGSYAADCTPPDKRAVAFGYFQGCLFLGIAFGPALGGFLIKVTGNVLSIFYIALVAHVLFIAFILFVVPESLSRRRMRKARNKAKLAALAKEQDSEKQKFSFWAHFKGVFVPLKILYPTGPGSSPALRRNILLLSVIDTVIFGVGMGAMTVLLLYAEKTFSWGNLESSLYYSIVNSTRVSVLFAVVPALSWIMRKKLSNEDKVGGKHLKGADKLDIFIIRFAVFIESIGYVAYALATTGSQFTVAGVMTAFGGAGSPTIQSALTKHVAPTQTGQLLGAMALLHSIARVVSPLTFNLIYAYTVQTVPQTVFYCLASTFVFAAVACWGLRPHREFSFVYCSNGRL
ncbi:MFS general substrate transporter [Ascobolus immersus RN42]|uniref:MFS general substrate transporter n=1 Tax=Ascobolus immersus RN42 TaxID=1160509 RepID=A0A3N4HPS5_ASCIM|nr:MFS general substrate transporter [Ascobolus immersus RN42]